MPASVPATSPQATAGHSGRPASNSTTMTKVPAVPIAAAVKLTTATRR